jgi:GYF domain 2
MADRSWFIAANGQQQGPYPEAQFRDLIARGAVNPQTLVWSEGMAGWLRAGEVPGLMGGRGGPPPMVPPGGAVMGTGGYDAGAGGGYAMSGNAMSIDFGILEFTWRTIVYALGAMTFILLPWTLVWYLKWIVSCVRVPGRPNLSFTGNAMTLVPWVAGLVVLEILAVVSGIRILGTLVSIGTIVATWYLVRWQVANIASNGQPVGLSFSGSVWAYIGYNLLMGISFITIIGWAWVAAAQARWFCRNIQGTRRAIVFKGTGLDILWRVIVVAIACSFIIPIPWMYRWIMQWWLSQTELVDRGAYANG